MLLSSFPSTKKDGVAIAMQIVSISDGYADACRQSERFLSVLEQYLAYGAFTGLIISHAILAYIIAANHGINLLGMFGVKKQNVENTKEAMELTEEQRAMLFGQLVQRQMGMEASLNEGNAA